MRSLIPMALTAALLSTGCSQAIKVRPLYPDSTAGLGSLLDGSHAPAAEDERERRWVWVVITDYGGDERLALCERGMPTLCVEYFPGNLVSGQPRSAPVNRR